MRSLPPTGAVKVNPPIARPPGGSPGSLLYPGVLRGPQSEAFDRFPLSRDLIRQVRQCKTQQEERNVISKESAALRQAFKEQDSTHRHRWG